MLFIISIVPNFVVSRNRLSEDFCHWGNVAGRTLHG
jgi:hypothetical protein